MEFLSSGRFGIARVWGRGVRGLALAFSLGAAAAARGQTCPITPCTLNSQCNDNKFCTADFCVGGGCICVHNDPQCDDGIFCDGANTCNTATDSCVEGPPVSCGSGTFCSEIFEACVQCEANAQCTTPPRLRCSASGTCVQCTSDSQCTDGSFCNGNETCNLSTGLCQSGTPVSCPKVCFKGPTPGATCNVDANCGTGGKCVGRCSENRLACVQCDTDSHCGNGLFCDGTETCGLDVCVVGTAPACKYCVGGPDNGAGCAIGADCGAPGTCTGTPGFCDEGNDRCQICMSDGHCNDGLSCTSDNCTMFPSGLNLCNNSPDNSICDNGLRCDGAEHCNATFTGCVNGTPPVCVKTCFRGPTPGATCTTDANCGRACEGGALPGASCTADSQCGKACVGGSNDGASCVNSTDCFSGYCRPGICVTAKCLGFCSEALDRDCVQCETAGTCSDGLFCTGGETCSAVGACAVGTTPNCSSLSNLPCKEGTCSESLDICTTQNINTGDECQDGDHCTASSACSAGVCANDPPASNDPFRCVRMEWRPSTEQTVTIGSTAILSLYAVADGCNTSNSECPTGQMPVIGVEALLGWTPGYLQLQPSTGSNPNPSDPCNNSNSCNECQVCAGGTNPNASCVQSCVGGANHGEPCWNAQHCPAGQCYSGPVCRGGTNNGNACTTNTQCPGRWCFPGQSGADTCNTCTSGAECESGICAAATCDTASRCLGGGTCTAPTLYNWDTGASLFPNDCAGSQMNGPCPSTGFPGNDGAAFYQSIVPISCANGCEPTSSRPACITPSGLHITSMKFKAIAIPPTGTTTVSLSACGPYPRRSQAFSAISPPPGYTTDDVLKSLGPAVSIRVVACDDAGDCNDGNGCTVDGCVNGSCSHLPISCNDQNLCTIDSCLNGVCLHDPVPCNPGEVCYLGLCYDPCSTVAQCDDGVACTDDVCDTSPPPPIDGVCRNTPNDAHCTTGLFCAQQECDPVLGCIPTEFCTNTDGNPCPNPANCNETNNNCGGCLPPTLSAVGSRYIFVTPDAALGSTPMALRLAGHCSDSEINCVTYVQSKCSGGSSSGANCLTDADCPKTCAGGICPGCPCTTSTQCLAGTCSGFCDAGTLSSTPFFKTAAQWGTAKVRGTHVRPSKQYIVQAECNFGGGGTVRSEGRMTTMGRWGDVDGDLDVDALDITAMLNRFRSLPGAVPFEQANIWPCSPDGTVNALDIALDLDAFRGRPYPCSTTCP